MNLNGAQAIITGGASGLGLAVAERLARDGARVAILDIQPPPVEPAMAQALYLMTDVASETSVERSVHAAAERFGGITLAVNCAGVTHSQRVVGRDQVMSKADFARVVAINLIGTFLVCRSVAQLMQHNPANADGERGVIVNTASIAAFDGQVGLSAYAASKGGVASLTLPLAREFASFGVRVMAIAPGLFETPMFDGLSDLVRARLKEQIPFPKRLGHPAEFAGLVCHIYENPMLNGTVIRLDGALRMPAK